MKYAIVENEYHAKCHLEEMTRNLRPEWELSFTSASVEETVSLLKEKGMPDLIFMDIELDDGISLDIFKRYDVNVPVIFTTAYDSYCLQAFKVNSLDYILKPIGMEDLLYAIRQYEMSVDKASSYSDKYSALSPEDPKKIETTRILIAKGESYSFVPTDKVAWFESEDKCIFLIGEDGGRHITSFASLTDIEKLTSEDTFFRVSRSHLVNISAIKEVKKSFNYKLQLVCEAGGVRLKMNVSSAKRKEFLAWFGHGMI